MKKRILLLFTIFIMGTTSVLAEVFVKDLSLIKKVEIEGKGKAGKSNVPALRQMESLDTAKKSSQKEIGNYIKTIKDKEGRTLEELAQTNTPLQLIFAETIKEGVVVFKEWDKEDNAIIRIEVNLEKLKEKLNRLGVE